MNNNQFDFQLTYQNDIEGFICPYKLQGQIDREVMLDKYMRLEKVTHGVFVRLGEASKGRH